MSILEFFASADGIAQLWAADGQFLGVLSSNQSDPNSINNPNTYGGFYSYQSIKNPASPYGGACGLYSPYNITCINPPVILYQGQPMLVVSKNLSVLTNGLSIIDPDLMLSVYTQATYQNPALVHQQTMADLTNTLLQTSADRSAISANAINQAMQNAANLFH
jgi:hypothetical protein